MAEGSVEFREALDDAQALEAAGRVEDAARRIQDLRHAVAPDAQAAAELGATARRLGLNDHAVHWFGSAARLAPDEPAHLGNLGNVYRAVGRLDEAAACYRRVIEAVPDSVAAFNNLGLTLRAKGASADAVDVYRRGLEIAPGLPELNTNLGMALLDTGSAADAERHCRAAFEARPASAEIATNLGVVLRRLDRPDAAIDCFEAALAQKPHHLEALRGLGGTYMSKHRWRESLEAYRRVIDIDPDCAEARNVVAALAGGSAAAPLARYVRDVFDRYADDFDRHLVEVLGYGVPGAVAAMLARHVEGGHLEGALDLGCGTGLFGEELKRLFRVDDLVGVDLSPKMIAKASEKAVYDGLETGEVVDYLSRTEKRFQLVSACDVFIYIGDLESVFGGVKDRLAGGGFFAFSVEETESSEFTLTPTGRYAHGRAYIEDLARRHGFSRVDREDIEIRREIGTPVLGSCILLRAS